MSYQILFFGKNLLRRVNKNIIENKNAEITFSDYPNDRAHLQNLEQFDIVILHFKTFYYNSHNHQDEKIFRKSISQAVKKGTYFCFLHYQEDVHTRSGIKHYFGAKVAKERRISSNYDDEIIISGKTKLNIFSPYLRKWGATHNYFNIKEPQNSDDIIYESDGKTLGFSFKKSRGQFIFLPFQKNDGSVDDNSKGLKILLDTLLNYKSKKEIKIPEWAEKPFFEEESDLHKKIDDHKDKLESLKEDLSTFTFTKSLLTSREYDLEDKIPIFFEDHLGLKTSLSRVTTIPHPGPLVFPTPGSRVFPR